MRSPRIIEAELVLEGHANPEGLPKGCAFQHRNGGIIAHPDHDLREVEMCRRDFDVVRKRAIYARSSTVDEVLDCFWMDDCDDLANI